ncbi:RNase RNM [Litorilituus lipolyticus]|uniref:PHP domain-containing protein n=1 Tax=Litorilituus lipolyticus TaxID=2491017 RepID=A0A502KWG5_9GAMM|nr:PHP domain-containing protein [Litorilituus lipolyticus]TPH12567.1 PHP domain-containing protein [Litorilituus lipolyticus]
MALLSTVDFPHTIKKTEGFSHGRIDLHSHTHCSDGELSPEALIDRAWNYQIDVLAITDHDTTQGLDIADAYIEEKNVPLKLIHGIEISTAWHGFEIHIVGLNIDKNDATLRQLIAEQQQARVNRAKQIGEKLVKCGFADVYEKALLLAGKGSITRAHFAKVLYQQGHVSTMQKAFDKYIGKGQRAFVKPNWCTIERAIEVIHQAGGTAVMAHPIRYDLSAKWLRRLIVQFKDGHGDGLEIVLPQMNQQQRQTMLNYCLEYNLLASLGSDFHRPNKWSDLGRHLTLPDGAIPIWKQWL